MEPTNLNPNEQSQQTEVRAAFELPSGRSATRREGCGQDLVNATRLATDPSAIPLALAAQLVEIDGQPVLFEDLLSMNLPDVMAIQGAVMGDLGKSSSPAAS